jgi:LmbE family N-acetylglucosaminyl deacetylase
MKRSGSTQSGYVRAWRRAAAPRVLVVAPHPDDDVLGCGGTLRRLAARGARISVLYVTDGSASHVKSKRFPPAMLRAVREGEARDALRELAIRTSPRFLRAPDGKLAELGSSERDALAGAIARAIDWRRAQLLFTPWDRDPHPDHVATAGLVEQARRMCRRRPATFRYSVWLPVRGTAADAPRAAEATVREIVLTPAEVDRKRAAIMRHRSQTSGLIDDDPDGFRIDASLLTQWLTPTERFFRSEPTSSG